jgi:hypothetical protein
MNQYLSHFKKWLIKQKKKKNEYDFGCNILGTKSEGKRPLGRPMHRWEDNIKLYFKKWSGRVQT